jgi:hypothetical protein
LDEDDRHICLAVAYHALGRQTDAQRELVACQVLDGDSSALVYAGVYAQWGDTRSALQWMLKGERLRDPMFQVLKVWWQLDPIRRDPQFKALAARMGFPP